MPQILIFVQHVCSLCSPKERSPKEQDQDFCEASQKRIVPIQPFGNPLFTVAKFVCAWQGLVPWDMMNKTIILVQIDV